MTLPDFTIPPTIVLTFFQGARNRGPVYVRAAGTTAPPVINHATYVAPLREMAEWLAAHGFRYRAGSNGVWDAAR